MLRRRQRNHITREQLHARGEEFVERAKRSERTSLFEVQSFFSKRESDAELLRAGCAPLARRLLMSHDDFESVTKNLRPLGHVFRLKLGPSIDISERRWPVEQSHFKLRFPGGVK